MNGLLLDTEVLGLAMRPQGRELGLWLAERDERKLFICVVTLGAFACEIERAKPDRASFERYAAALEQLRERFDDRVLPINAAIAQRAGELAGRASAAGDARLSLTQTLVAATAFHHGLTLLALEPAAFGGTGVQTQAPPSQPGPSLEPASP